MFCKHKVLSNCKGQLLSEPKTLETEKCGPTEHHTLILYLSTILTCSSLLTAQVSGLAQTWSAGVGAGAEGERTEKTTNWKSILKPCVRGTNVAIICGETIQKENVIAFLEVTGQRSTAAITERGGASPSALAEPEPGSHDLPLLSLLGSFPQEAEAIELPWTDI